ncbi:MAG: hypothetical protein LUE12_03495 [Ruminococcus sp.]|nr:hypothetical protein [Ruminococcus sp.]
MKDTTAKESKKKIDRTGKIFLPAVFKNSIGVSNGETVKLLLRGDEIVVKKDKKTCVFCGTDKNVSDVMGKGVCKNCIEEIKVER